MPILDDDYIDNAVKARYHCRITRKQRGPAHRDDNLNPKLNHKIYIVFHNLKNYILILIMQKLGNPEINVIPNGLEKRSSFTIYNELIFIDSFQFLSSS